jgi:hypothetical protein
MRRHALVVLTLLAAVVLPSSARAQALVHDWSGGFGDANYQYGIDVDVDAAGNVVTVGDYFGTVNFGGGPLTSAGDLDVYVAKFDAAGNHLWSLRFGDTDRQLAKSVAVDDSDGSIVVAGIFQGSIDFGGGPLVSAGGFDAFMVKFDASGNYDWSRSYGDSGDQLAYVVAVDLDHNVVLTGPFTNKVDFGGGALTSAGSNDVYIALFDLNGDLQWAERYGDASAQATYGLATDADGNILATGGFGGTLDFGGAPLVSAGLSDIFVVKLDRGGSHMWSASFGDGLDQYGIGVTADSQGNVLGVGDFEGTVDFGGGPISSAGWYDAFLAKLDGAGGHLWSHGFGEGNGQFTGGVAVDADDHVAMAGYFEVAIDLGGGPIAGVGTTDGYVARFDAAGNHLWSDGFGAALENQYGIACATDAAGGIAVIGYGSGDFDFGGGTIPSGGAEDAYLVKYSAPEPGIQMIVDVPGDQGGWARLFFTRALSDEVGASPYPVINYHVFRRVDNPALAARVLSEGREAAPSPELPATLGGAPILSLEGRAFWRPAAADMDARAASASRAPSFVVWEAVATVPARQQPFYIGLVPTLADSGAVVQHSVYFVMAQTTTPWVYYDSAPDSGYSVDNLSPATPQGLAGTPVVSPAALTLAWDPNGENDLSHYAVYRGNTIGFVPGPGNRVGTPTSPLFVDGDWEWSSGFYYKVAALDVHGNESGYAVLSPEEVTGVGGGAAPSASFLSQNHPNPFSASTHIAFGLREDADVRIRIYDVAGRLVRDLVDGRYAADRHLVSWDGRDDAGRAVAGGVYFYRIDAGAFVETRKLLLMR